MIDPSGIGINSCLVKSHFFGFKIGCKAPFDLNSV